MGPAERQAPLRTVTGKPGTSHQQGGGLRGPFSHPRPPGSRQDAVQGALDGAWRTFHYRRAGPRSAPGKPHPHLGQPEHLARGRPGSPGGEDALRALAEPGLERDNQLVLALEDEGTLLEDEPVGEWAVRSRERLEWARQEGRLALARDRTQGFGRSQPPAVVQAWEACLSHDATCEEAASALDAGVRGARKTCSGGRHLPTVPCRPGGTWAAHFAGLEGGPRGHHFAPPFSCPRKARSARVPFREERRLVSVLFGELSGQVGLPRLDPEDLRELVGRTIAELISEVELLGGTVTSVSGAGVAALFGAPLSHEDDPERAVRAGYRILSTVGVRPHLSLRVGIETGQAVVGPIGKAARLDYGAVGQVVGTAAALQSVAKPGRCWSVRRRCRRGGDLRLGRNGGRAQHPGGQAHHRVLPGPTQDRPSAQAGRRRLAGSAPLMGTGGRAGSAQKPLREATAGKGSVVLVAGEPGLGKTRLVWECRKLFMAWVGGASGRLPLWLEGRAASYRRLGPTGSTSSCSPCGWAWLPKRPRSWSAPPWKGR